MSDITLERSPTAPPMQAVARAPQRRSVRAMTAADITAVARLFLRVFRKADKPAGDDLEAYLRQLTLEAPSYSDRMGTQVFEQEGRIPSALITVPMRFVTCGNVVAGRLLGVYMTDSGQATGAAAIMLALRPKGTDFAFCDSSSPTSRDHVLAIGGKPVMTQNLEWSRSFQPLSAFAGRLAERSLGRWHPGMAVLTRPIDHLLRGWVSRKDAKQVESSFAREMSIPDFIKHAPRLIAHYAVRPLWSEEELSWLVSLAAQNTRLGTFSIRAVDDNAGAVIGCYVYYATPHVAHVLNVLSLPGRETAVLDAMFRALDRAGHLESRGRAQPALMMGLALQRWLVLRHKAFTVALTRIPGVNEAVARGDVYIGGLAGEDWSRLM